MANDAFSTQSQSVYDESQVPASSLLPAQIPPSAPNIVQAQTGTDLAIADRTIRSRLEHFPDSLYDLRDESHLVRFMSALIGDSGAGQLRKRYMLARINSSLNNANFFDLDGFYGAIFASGRRPYEELPVDPYVAVETPDEWDDILARDARYRERLSALAASIPLAGTLPGIRQAAEAITGVECDVYEVWRFIDEGTNLVAGLPTWADVEVDYTTWADIQSTPWPAAYTVGGLGVTTPAEVIIRPKRTYDLNDPEDVQEKGLNELALTRVLHVLRPANTVITIDNEGLRATRAVAMSAVDADSEYWEVITKVTPSPVIRKTRSLYPLAPSQERAGVEWGSERTMPRPTLVMSQGLTWEQASSVVSVSAATVFFENGDDVTQPGSGEEFIENPLNYESLTFYDGTSTVYSAERGTADPKTVQGGITAAGGILTAAPYAATRTTTEPR
jgi:hypothetical protein